MSFLGFVAGALGGAATVTLIDETVSDAVSPGSEASAAYRLTSAGEVEAQTSSGILALGFWVQPSAAAGAAFEARATVTAGALSSGTVGAWLSLDTSRGWTLSRTAAGASGATVSVEIRSTSTLAVLASAVINLSVEVS